MKAINMRWMILVLVLSLGVSEAKAQTDTTKVLTFEAFLDQVRTGHPLAFQAKLQTEQGRAELRRSRGAFDPKLFSDISQKQFDRSEYYSLIQAGLKVPTWFGLEFNTVYSENRGVFLNPENNLPDPGLWQLGVSWTLGKGLIMDERRAELKKAQIYQQSTEVEQQLMLNNLLYQAGLAYWEWFEAYSIKLVYEEAVNLAQIRLDAVRASASLGDRPLIDTLESNIQVQNRMLGLQQADLKYKNATLLIEAYLWANGIVPLELEGITVPEGFEAVDPAIVETPSGLQMLVANHPELRLGNYEIDQLQVERRLQREGLKPTVNLKYNALNEPINGNPLEGYNSDNYTWGLEFGIPLFLRQARGKVRMTDLKIQQKSFDLANKGAAIGYKIQAALNDWDGLNDQIALYRSTVDQYQQLLVGERQLFNAGESSLFLVNSREMSYINARVKLVELVSKQQLSALKTRFAMGTLN